MLLCLLTRSCLLRPWIRVSSMIRQWRPSRTHRLHPQEIWTVIWQPLIRLRQSQMTQWQEWMPLATPLVDLRQAILPPPQWMRQMQLLVQLWMALWIKVEHRRLQTLAQLLLKMQVQLLLTTIKANQIHPLEWVN